MSYELLQNLIVALVGVAALLFLLDRGVPSLRRRLAERLQLHPGTAKLGRRLQPAASGGHCGSSNNSGGGCSSCSGCGSNNAAPSRQR